MTLTGSLNAIVVKKHRAKTVAKRIHRCRRSRIDLKPQRLREATNHMKEIDMLGNTDASANIAVKNLETAGKFYEGTLGLTRVGAEGKELIVYKSGNTMINVYRSRYAGTNQATAVTWVVGEDLEAIARALKGKGVSFEHYDMPDMTREGDVHVAGDMKVVWFKDPDGNILNLVNG
jgi:catechol 2,3-dioxygenase-like lactoylglutathione lyase family enzyme